MLVIKANCFLFKKILFTRTHSLWGLMSARIGPGWSQEVLGIQLDVGDEEGPNRLSHHLGCSWAGSWNWEYGWALNPGNPIMGFPSGVLSTLPNTCLPSSFLLFLFIYFLILAHVMGYSVTFQYIRVPCNQCYVNQNQWYFCPLKHSSLFLH